ncbi:hypothetical protein BDR06DRAFT_865742, partial [Suillus hirtellus]
AKQKKAFALLQVTDIHIANDILLDKIYITSEHFNIYKDKRESIQCPNCQRFSHIVKNCTTLTDTCGTYGGQPCTTNC